MRTVELSRENSYEKNLRFVKEILNIVPVETADKVIDYVYNDKRKVITATMRALASFSVTSIIIATFSHSLFLPSKISRHAVGRHH